MPSGPFPASPPAPGIPGPFIALVVIAALCSVGFGIWRFSVLRRGGLNPFVAKEQIEARIAQSQLLTPVTPEKSIEQRLAEVDDLRNRGVITDEEHTTARAKIIAGN